MHTFEKPILGVSSIHSASFPGLFQQFQGHLAETGYNRFVARLHLHSVAHFVVWLEREGIHLETIDQQTVAAFSRHRSRCRCPGASTNRGRHVDSCVRVFVRYLRSRRLIRTAEQNGDMDDLIRGFLDWARVHRGVVNNTLVSYERYVVGLVDALGNDPQTYTAGGLREFVSERYGHYGCNSIRMVLAAVRMFLRYLAVSCRCRPGLEQALVAPASWSKSTVPRGLPAEDIERVLAACPSTARGVRDRAVLLLLIRLGLRAGDVSGLKLSDLCFR